MNRQQMNSLQKEQWPMVECVLLMLNVVLFCCLNEWGRESVCPARKYEEEAERAFPRPFILPGKFIRVEWLKSSSLDENTKSKPQQIPALNNNLKIFLSATQRTLALMWNPHRLFCWTPYIFQHKQISFQFGWRTQNNIITRIYI